MAVTDRPAFGVETIELDLPPLVSALSRRLLRDAGVPITPGRSVGFAEALTLVRPISRRRLYWTARVFVSDPAQVDAFDAVFFSVFGSRREAEDDDSEENIATRPVDWRTSPSTSDESDEDPAELEVPSLIASDEERLGQKSFDQLEPHELAQLYRLMSRLQLAAPPRRTRRYEKGRRGEHIDLRGPAREPAHGGRSNPPRAQAPTRRPAEAGDALRHLRLDGAVRAGVPAVPDLRRQAAGRTPRRSCSRPG